jgi:hypothetical protein
MSSTLHPDGKLNPHNSIANDSGNANILDLIEQRQLSRRGFLKSSLGVTAGATAVAVLGSNIVDGLTNYANAAPTPLNGIGFTPVPANTVPMIDAVTVPPGYTAKVLVSWGDSLTNAPHWDTVSAMDEATQLRCFGSHIDGMHLFPFPGNLANNRGLLVANHEYTDPGLVHSTFTYGSDVLTSAMVNTQLAAHGVGIVEIQKTNGTFQVKRPSAFNRRITGKTPCKISGPAAGHVMMQTAADPTGMTVLGTLNNCAHGYTPWGTYLTCEENFNGYFGSKTPLVQTNHEKRYGVTANGFGYRWHTADDRFDVNLNRNEANRFGWVVEIDPWNPNSTPVKRTAMGRFKHESAQLVVDDNDRPPLFFHLPQQTDDRRLGRGDEARRPRFGIGEMHRLYAELPQHPRIVRHRVVAPVAAGQRACVAYDHQAGLTLAHEVVEPRRAVLDPDLGMQRQDGNAPGPAVTRGAGARLEARGHAEGHELGCAVDQSAQAGHVLDGLPDRALVAAGVAAEKVEAGPVAEGGMGNDGADHRLGNRAAQGPGGGPGRWQGQGGPWNCRGVRPCRQLGHGCSPPWRSVKSIRL